MTKTLESLANSVVCCAMRYLKVSVVAAAAFLVFGGCGGSGGDPPSGSARETADPGRAGRTTPSTSERTMVARTSDDGQLAPENGSRVPRVAGMTVAEALHELRRSGYGCAVIREEDHRGAGPRRVVAQEPTPGARGSEGQLVHLTVSEPFRGNSLPRGCVDQRDEPWATTPSGQG